MNGPHPRIRRSATGATHPFAVPDPLTRVAHRCAVPDPPEYAAYRLAVPRHRDHAVPDPLTCAAAVSAARPGPPGRRRA